MKRLALACAVLVVSMACSPREGEGPSPTPTAEPASTATPAATATTPPSATATRQPTAARTPSPTATPTPTPEPKSIELLFDDEVDDRERALVQLGVLTGESYANEQFGGGARRPVFVHVANEGVCINGAQAIGYEICVNAGARRWEELSPDYLKLKVMAHEYFHVWQHDLFCYREPKWMFEGLAEWWGYEAIIDSGLVESVAASVERQQVLQASPIREPLSEQELLYAAPTRPQYALWSFAAQRLMAGNGHKELRTFCAGRAEDLTWQESFEAAFAMTVEEFYKEFEEWREGFLPWSAVE